MDPDNSMGKAWEGQVQEGRVNWKHTMLGWLGLVWFPSEIAYFVPLSVKQALNICLFLHMKKNKYQRQLLMTYHFKVE